mgnify:CR=1 FL=1
MEKYVFQSKSNKDLIEKSLNELNVKREEVLIKESEEKAGLFGKKYTIEIVKLTDAAEVGKEILIEMFNALGMKVNIETKVRDESIKYEIFSKNNSLLIGKRGHILNSIQVYLRQAIYNALDFYINIQVDVENYKEKQNYFLEKKVKKIARDVTLSKGEVKLDPMNSYERKVVHAALQGFKYIKTESEGEEPNRCVVIKYYESEER